MKKPMPPTDETAADNVPAAFGDIIAPSPDALPGPRGFLGLRGVDEEPPALTEEEERQVKCKTCKHYWAMVQAAPVKNRKPDGSGFVRYERFCTVIPKRPMTLEARLVLDCNRYEEQKQ